MSSSSSFEEYSNTVNQQFVVDANPNYDFTYREHDTYPVQNMAKDVMFHNRAQNGNQQNQLDFTIDVPSNFMERDLYINIDSIPLTFTRKVAVPANDSNGDPITITEDNFVETFFNNYSDLAYKQHGFLNAVDSISIALESSSNFAVRKVPEALKLTSPYAEKSIVFEKLDNSMPDLMSYDKLLAGTAQVTSRGFNGRKIGISPTLIKQSSPFGSLGDLNYNTRQPILSFTSIDTARRTISCATDELQLLLPFSLFSIPGEEAPPLIGGKKIMVTVALKNEWWKFLFCSTKPDKRETTITHVELDRSKPFTFSARAIYRCYKPQTYVENGYGLNNGRVPRHNIAYQKMTYSTATSLVNVKDVTTVTSLYFNVNAIPKAIYIGAKLHPRTDSDVIHTADVWARVRSLECSLDGRKTTICPTSAEMYQFCKKNGLSLPKESAYLGGYPVRLITTNDLASNNDGALVGALCQSSNSFVIEKIELENVDNYGVDQQYEIQVVFIHDGLIAYSDGVFVFHDSLVALARTLNIELHAANLYNNTIPGMNVVGGNLMGFLSKWAPTGKKLISGLIRIAKDRELHSRVANHFNGKDASWNKKGDDTQQNASGAGFSSKAPALGGYYQSNVTGGQDIGRFRY